MQILASGNGYHTIRIVIEGVMHDLTVLSQLEGAGLVAFLNDYATSYEQDLRSLWAAMAAEEAEASV